MNTDYCNVQTNCKTNFYTANVYQKAIQNTNYRTTLWTGCHAQMTLMSIPVCSDIGFEIHEDTDQIIRIEDGIAMVTMGVCKNCPDYQHRVCAGDTIFVPAGTWHNVINTGRTPLKISAVYAPPHHPAQTLHRTKKDATDSY